MCVGLQVLAEYIDFVFGQDAVDLGQYSSPVFVDVNQAVGIAQYGQLELGEVHAAMGRAGIDVLDDSAGDVCSGALPCLNGIAADAWGEEGVGHGL